MPEAAMVRLLKMVVLMFAPVIVTVPPEITTVPVPAPKAPSLTKLDVMVSVVEGALNVPAFDNVAAETVKAPLVKTRPTGTDSVPRTTTFCANVMIVALLVLTVRSCTVPFDVGISSPVLIEDPV